MRIVRAVYAVVFALVFVPRELYRAYRTSRSESIDVGEALARRQAVFEAEAQREADREEWRRELMRDMPPPP